MDVQALLNGELMEKITTLITFYGIKVIGSIVILILGKWATDIVTNMVKRLMKKADTAETLISFVSHLTKIGLLAFVIIAALNNLGIQTASFIAVLGAAGLAVGLALQGSLSNFAAGVLLIIFRPIKVGDLAEIDGIFGRVKEIQIFNTILLTPQNKRVVIPNSNVTGNKIINYSAEGIIRLDLVFGISYGDNLLKAKQILEELVAAEERILKDPAPTVAVLELGDSSVNFATNVFIDPEDYWGVLFAMTENVKLRFDQEGITIPFPQRDVHLFQEK